MTKSITLNPGEVKAIPLSAILPDPSNIRKHFDPDSIKALAADIKRRGLEQPIVVTVNGKAGSYIIKHGERRFRAVKLNKEKTIDCTLGILETGAGKTAAEKTIDAALQRKAAQWAENMLREDINAIDEAEFYKECRDVFKIPAKDIPARLAQYGIQCEYTDGTIRGMIRLTELPNWAKDYIRAGLLTASHGRALLPMLKSPNVEKDLQKDIAAYFKAPVEDDPLTVNALLNSVDNFFEHHHPNAGTFRRDWMNDDKRVLYDIKKLNKETLEKLNTVEVTDGRGGKETYILNTQLHQQLQKQAKEEIMRRGKSGSKSSGSGSKTGSKGNGKDTGDKPEPKTEASADRLCDWLHRYLAAWTLNKLKVMTPEQRHPIVERILIWLSLNAPGDYSGYSQGVKGGQETAAEDLLDINNLNDALNSIHTLDHVQNVLAFAVIPREENEYDGLDFEATVALANHLQFNIDKDIRINAAFAEMYTGDGIEKIVHQAKLQDNPAWKGSVKTSEKRNYAVTAAEGIATPKAIKELWTESLPKPPKTVAGTRSKKTTAGTQEVEQRRERLPNGNLKEPVAAETK